MRISTTTALVVTGCFLCLVVLLGPIGFYQGMMSYCLYVPYYYVDSVPRYRTEEDCREVVDDAISKHLYFNRVPLSGPGIDFGPGILPFEEN